jgi:hypothetical protein
MILHPVAGWLAMLFECAYILVESIQPGGLQTTVVARTRRGRARRESPNLSDKIVQEIKSK